MKIYQQCTKLVINAKLVFILLVFIFVNKVDAQDDGVGAAFNFFAGGSVPNAPTYFDTNWGKGFNVGMMVDMMVNPNSDLSLSLEMHRFSLNESNFKKTVGYPEHIEVIGKSASIISFQLNWKRYFADDGKFIPFFLLGIGSVRIGEDRLDSYNGERSWDSISRISRTRFGYSTGLGFEVPINDKIDVVFEGRHLGNLEKAQLHLTGIRIGIKIH